MADYPLVFVSGFERQGIPFEVKFPIVNSPTMYEHPPILERKHGKVPNGVVEGLRGGGEYTAEGGEVWERKPYSVPSGESTTYIKISIPGKEPGFMPVCPDRCSFERELERLMKSSDEIVLRVSGDGIFLGDERVMSLSEVEGSFGEYNPGGLPDVLKFLKDEGSVISAVRDKNEFEYSYSGDARGAIVACVEPYLDKLGTFVGRVVPKADFTPDFAVDEKDFFGWSIPGQGSGYELRLLDDFVSRGTAKVCITRAIGRNGLETLASVGVLSYEGNLKELPSAK